MDRVFRSATNVITLLTAAAWIVTAVLGLDQQAALAFGFIPDRLSGGEVPWAAVPTILTPLSATLVHSGPIHLGFNLLIFLWCGREVERVLGNTGLVVLYLVGAYAAAIAQWAMDPSGTVPMVGASGAISAIMGAFALSFGRPRMITRSPALNRWINAIWLMAAWIVLQVMMGWLGDQQGYLLATPAHVGGFAAGLILQRPLLLWRYRKA
jgi:membrane associated rhomboid family serine protease